MIHLGLSGADASKRARMKSSVLKEGAGQHTTAADIHWEMTGPVIPKCPLEDSIALAYLEVGPGFNRAVNVDKEEWKVDLGPQSIIRAS